MSDATKIILRRSFSVEGATLEIEHLIPLILSDMATQGTQRYLTEWADNYNKRRVKHHEAIKIIGEDCPIVAQAALTILTGSIAQCRMIAAANHENIRDYFPTVAMIATGIIYSKELQNIGLWT